MNYEALYRAEVEAHNRTRTALQNERQARASDKAYHHQIIGLHVTALAKANVELSVMTWQRDDLLAIMQAFHQGVRPEAKRPEQSDEDATSDIPDLAAMTEDQRRHWFTTVQVKA